MWKATTNWLAHDIQEQHKAMRKRRWARRLKIINYIAIVVSALAALYISIDAIIRVFPATYIINQANAEKQRYFLLAEVSAYTSSADETDDNPNENAMGNVPQDGSIACPDRFIFGTRVIISGKEYVCDDRMNIRYRKGNYFDIWHKSKKEAYEFGRQQIIIEIL